LTIWHCILSAELTKTHFFGLFFGDFAHWDGIIDKMVAVNDSSIEAARS